jgi:predicted nucleotidyltransferase
VTEIKSKVFKKEDVFFLLMQNKEKLTSMFGVKRIGVFGSAIRNELKENSDIDVIVELERGKARIRNVVELERFLQDLFGRKVDLLTFYGVRSIRIPWIRDRILKEVVYVW